MERILSATWDQKDGHTLEVYKKNGGYKSLEKALKMKPADVTAEVKKANLRGRGGAGFPAGVKWGFVPQDPGVLKYLVVNADEGEPGTFKDRVIMEKSPHMMIEGSIITAFAVGLNAGFIYIRGEFQKGAGADMERAIEEAYKAGYLGKNILGSGFDFEFHEHYGAGAYICGEETALIESIEGKAGQPRLKPPFPAAVGLFGLPTVINNVETMACVPSIIERGGDWFASLGNEGSGGTKLFGICGHVEKPGVYEAPHGINLKDVIYDLGGGIWKGRKLKAAIPGGSSCPVFTADEIDVAMDIKSVQEAGSMFGTAGVIVVDDQTCIVRLAARTAHFYHHESCGQCTPCREGTGWAERILNDIEAGRATHEDIDLLLDVCNNVQGNTICALGDAMAMPIRSFVEKFEEEFRRHVDEGGCPFSD